MHHSDFFFQAFIYLSAAIVSVPIAKRLGLGSVLGYLLAGIIIGPNLLGLVGDTHADVMKFAEIGVVMMLFLIGLELEVERLWHLRGPILGLGGLQVLLTTGAIYGVGLFFGYSWQTSLAIGMTLALSSTAMVLQIMNEKGFLKTKLGRSSFSVLLFQDISIIPMLALMPLLASHSLTNGAAHHTGGGLQRTFLMVGTVAGIIVLGRFVVHHVFHYLANTKLREILTAAALLLIVSITLAMEHIGLSPALGTFLAGVVLADNEFRHQIETDIEPFKGLLLGLFFISVGANIDFRIIFAHPEIILGIVLGLFVLKALILFILAKVFRMNLSNGLLFALTLAQGGEFGFVLFAFAGQLAIIPPDLLNQLTASIAASMLLTPLVLLFHEKVISHHLLTKQAQEPYDQIETDENPVIIAGFGRFGQIIGRLLKANGFALTILDYEPKRIEFLKQFGHKVFYGDASRLDMLEAAKAKEAKLFVLAINDRDKSLEIVETLKKNYPHLTILARAIDRSHAYELLQKGVRVFRRETFLSALDLGAEALRLLGYHPYRALQVARKFRHYDRKSLFDLFQHYGKDDFIQQARTQADDLERLIHEDESEMKSLEEDSWS